jgi:hypothetical protein
MRKLRSAVVVLTGLSWSAACGDDDDDRGDVGRACALATQCYSALKEEPHGAAVCLDRVPGGYCTHECNTDEDCCAVPGECPDGREQVCGPFESTGKRLCFLSCEAQNDAYCARYAYAGFGCRSTGGGSDNRKVCVP